MADALLPLEAAGAVTPTSLTPPTPSSSHSPHPSSHSQPPSSSPNESPSPSSTPSLPLFSSGLYDALHPALSTCDAAITSVFTAQTQLAAQIDSLAALLASFQQLSKSAVFAPYTEKLRSAKRRVKRLQAAVERINERMDDCREMVRRKEGLDGGAADRQRSTAGGLLSAPATAEAALVGGLKGLTEKVVSSLASITQQKAAPAPRPAAAAAAAAEPKGDDAAAAPTYRHGTPPAAAESAAADASDAAASSSSSALPASFLDSAAIAATTETNNALLHDLLSWDQH